MEQAAERRQQAKERAGAALAEATEALAEWEASIEAVNASYANATDVARRVVQDSDSPRRPHAPENEDGGPRTKRWD